MRHNADAAIPVPAPSSSLRARLIAASSLGALALGVGLFVGAGCSDGSISLSCDPATDPACADASLSDSIAWPDGTTTLPDGAVQLPDGQVVQPDGAPIDTGTTNPDAATCHPFGELCQSGAECCSGVCDSGNHCTSTIGACKAVAQPCSGATECCSLACVNGACSADACTSDGKACTSGAECCGGNCSGGTCQPLNPSCKTAGNACAGNTDCCSKLCKAGKCELAASYCTQLGDVCTRGLDCCTGICDIKSGATVGTCAANSPGGSNCSGGVDGTVCDGDCGSCCSRLCAPYGPSGVKICQPASGCHVNGDLCRSDYDCCGAPNTGLPGEGNGKCVFEPGQTIGICRNPISCNPEGNVCHYKQDSQYQCSSSSSRNDCCGATGNSGVCKLDALGIPRCYGGGACKPAGQACAYSGDCCNGLPCVPNPSGSTPPFVCGAAACQPAGTTCTIDGDCCQGLTCNKPPGSASGTCGGTTPPPPTDGGTDGSTETGTDGGTTDGGTTDSAPGCSLYGQACKSGADCCNNFSCRDVNGQLCTGTAGCTCHEVIQ